MTQNARLRTVAEHREFDDNRVGRAQNHLIFALERRHRCLALTQARHDGKLYRIVVFVNDAALQGEGLRQS